MFDARLDFRFRFRFRRFRSAPGAHGFGVGFWQEDHQEDGLSDEKHEGKSRRRGIDVEFVSPRFGNLKWPSSKISSNGRADAETHCECDAYKRKGLGPVFGRGDIRKDRAFVGQRSTSWSFQSRQGGDEHCKLHIAFAQTANHAR